MDESAVRYERFQLLLEQIGIPAELGHTELSSGRIDKLDVYREKRTWHFTFRLEKPVTPSVIQLIQEKLQSGFQDIAAVDFSIVHDAGPVSSEHIAAYWPAILAKATDLPAHIAMQLERSTPAINGTALVLRCHSEVEATSLARQAGPALERAVTALGFEALTFSPQVEAATEEETRFLEQKKEEEQTKVIEAMMEKQKQEKPAEPAERKQLHIGYPIKDEPLPLTAIQDEERRVTIQGYVFAVETRELRSGRVLLTCKLTDYTDSLLVKMFSRDKEDIPLLNAVQKGMWLTARGSIQNDTFVRDLVMIANDITQISKAERMDEAPDNDKRIELHAHTTMSQMDGVASASEMVEKAADWGHEAVAITDHGVVQAFPEAYAAAKKKDIKLLYGMEAYLVDDGVPIAYNESERHLAQSAFVVFDVETTGLSAVYDTIIELAAVKVENGEIVDRFESFAQPHMPLPAKITELTGITDEMLTDASDVGEVLRQFADFVGDAGLVAHNASFDIGFINAGFKQQGWAESEQPVVDTLELARFLYPNMKNYRLNTLCKQFDIELVSHHRAIYDTEATAYLFMKMIRDAHEQGIVYHRELNDNIGQGDFYKNRPSHCTILVQNQTGLKNLYELVSLSHMSYFYRTPRIPRSKLVQHREGLLIGSGCDQGEVFETMMQKSAEEAEKVARFYDFIEIHPPDVYAPLLEREMVKSEAQLLDIIRKLTEVGERLERPVVATGNVHYLEPEDHIYRTIIVSSQGGGHPLSKQTLPKVHFRTTGEMLEAFSFLGEETAQNVVIHTPKSLAGQIEAIAPVPSGLYTPNIEGADEEMRDLTYGKAKRIYGSELPRIVEERLQKELESIIGHGYGVIYLISHKLVKRSLEDGYLVGSRGSVGSSFVATMADITEVNPLPPHYVCPGCCHSVFFDDGSVASGYDLPKQACEQCGTTYTREGQDIPFETFLGFEGKKVPDIDLNFSGEYQPIAHAYTRELFGDDKVFRAGTIGTVADKTAYGFVRGYQTDQNIGHLRGAEIDRLVDGCTGAKRNTGQHPGGIIVVPEDHDIHDFTPVQYPADDKNASWKTTHFDFHSIDDNLLKLDILGHDDPTVIRMLQDLSGIDPQDVPIDDPEVMRIFEGPEVLGVTPEQIMCKTGTYGIPEFGTRFVRQMLEETKPQTFSELLQISGLSHGADVWVGNADELIRDGICELKDVIGLRDNIMVNLIYKGLEPSLAFKITEFVRKGRGLEPEWIEEMKKHDIPDWYIESCKKIKYMFPKAHAAAYVLMAVRIAYFKVHYPILFYATYFSVRAADFELETMQKGSTAIRARIEDIQAKGFEAAPKEKSLVTVLELALEMTERGYSFGKIDLYRSEASTFIVDGDTLIPPFGALEGVGANAAKNIVEARSDGEFLSKEDLQQKSKATKNVIQLLDAHGCLEGLPESNQLSLF
ncbi:PolC-type DNA polymerase III [Natribacillus halophilus]|uniref:DNA polymerase III PolC-type n=1 Tax=Natribacillus halophilus TaxID=549003 RepID=A0A1G8PQ32_9BACI|nr:PolC-type DNA polymerase III [Natribacillus halophilus]SDI94512.1 DNA polymerase III catalytic subunit, PolC type [Natribacillus halophilus]